MGARPVGSPGSRLSSSSRDRDLHTQILKVADISLSFRAGSQVDLKVYTTYKYYNFCPQFVDYTS